MIGKPVALICSKGSGLPTAATKFCLLSCPGNTALTQQYKFLIWSGLETFSGQAVDAGLVKTEELPGNLRGQTRYSILSESDLPSTAKKRVSRAPKARVRTLLLEL